jgi:hypothetical protein
MDAKQWASLKASHRGLNLRMPCCAITAIPKTSSRGTYFFAHKRRGECATADESPEHLYCKSLVAKAALDAGWMVTTERPGVSPAGEEWVADVFCEKGGAKVALEVQMSPQSDDETAQRQQRYLDSGVHGAWFFGAKGRQGARAFGKDTPTFTMRPVVVGEPPALEQFDLTLPEFVMALLQKRIAWFVPTYSRPHLVEFIEDVCWACKKPVKQVLEHAHGGHSTEGEALRPGDFYEGRWNPTAYTVAKLSKMIEAMHADISNDELQAQGLNLVGRQDSIQGKPTRFPFCNLCIHCRAPQNNHFVSERIYANMRAQRAAKGKWTPYGSEEAEGSQEDEAPDTEEHQAVNVATIPREIRGSGRWALREPANRG